MMPTFKKTSHWRSWVSAGLMTGTVALGLATNPAFAQDDNEALKILQSMSDYLAGQTAFTARFESGIEVVTNDLEKIQFNSSGEVAVERPGKLRARRTGGFVDLEMVYDGKSLVVHLPEEKVYSRADAPSDIDGLIDGFVDQGISFPGADLLMSNTYEVLTENVNEAKHIGTGVIGGAECEHLAFRNDDSDWQLWVRTGDEPIPCKYVITSKHVTGAPQYTLVITEWKAGAEGDFEFKPGSDEKELSLKDMPHFDAVPQETEQ